MAYQPDQNVAVEREHLEKLIRDKEAWLRARARAEGMPQYPDPLEANRASDTLDRPISTFVLELDRVDKSSVALRKTIEDLQQRLSGLMAPTPTNGTLKDKVPRPKMAPLVERVHEIGDRIEGGIAQLRALLDGLQV